MKLSKVPARCLLPSVQLIVNGHFVVQSCNFHVHNLSGKPTKLFALGARLHHISNRVEHLADLLRRNKILL